MSGENDYWRNRSKRYNQLDWVKNYNYIEQLLENFVPGDLVLDVGCGTGIMMDALSEAGCEVIGVDISEDMLDGRHNTILWDAHDLSILFNEDLFDKVLMRMVLHHILDCPFGVLMECMQVLRPGGKLIIAEGIPPNGDVKEEFTKIFEIKEERLVFTEEDLIGLMGNAAYDPIKVERFVMPQMSIRNWLENSGLNKRDQDKIMALHRSGSVAFKQAYNMVMTDNDCLCDFHVAIVAGTKT